MRELDFLEIINSTLSKKSHLGDDCAYLEEIGIVVTQDSLVEGIHFLPKLTTPYQLGYKAIIVNLSDILASGALPKYVTIALSLPDNIDSKFVKEFYMACEDLTKEYGFEIIGGDITGSDKIFISVCAIGMTKGRNISSRRNAKVGDYVITTGLHGSSAAGLFCKNNNIRVSENLLKAHFVPEIAVKISNEIATKVKRNYSMMDTSDGLADALFKIAQASSVSISVDFDIIPYDKEIEEVACQAGMDFKDWVLYGGEDYQLVACLDEQNLKNINADYTIIGRVKEKADSSFVEVKFSDRIEKISDLEKTYNHFKKDEN